jgi:hypothetical protein
MLTGAWTVLMAAAVLQATVVPSWLGVVGILVGPVLVLSSFEFVGPFEPSGWAVAARITPIAYIAWSLWLVGIGVALIV